MSKNLKKFLGLWAAVAAFAPSAFAQEESVGLDEVVVTAQFREQNVQDTPIAITAISGDTLQARGQFSVEEIGAQAPGVSLTTGGAFAGPSLVAFIRGVGQTDFNPALEPGVGLYVDDVYYSTLTGAVLELLDLDRVEVLRGPQGTLAGKNSIGGAIRLFSKRPDEDANGYVEVSGGDLNALRVRAATNMTLVEDKLWARISGVSSSRDGHVTTYDYGCTHPGGAFPALNAGAGCKTGTDGGVDYTAARVALRWQASSNLEINFSADAVNDDSESTANTLLAVGPTIAPVIHPNGLIWETVAIPPTLGSNVGCQFIAYGPASCDPRSPNDPYASYADYTDPRTGLRIPRARTLQSRGASLNVDWDISPTLSLQSITGYREYESSFSGDYDASPMPTALLFQTNTHKQWSQELRLNGSFGDFADWTVGGFYFDANSDLSGRIDLGYVGFDFIHGPDPVKSKNWAIFANSIFSVTEQLKLVVGARYSEDEKDYTFRRRNPDLGAIQPCLGPPGTPGNPPNCLISTLDGVNSVFSDDRIDYRAAVNYDVTDDIMAYVSYSTGYKGGGVNPRPFYNVQAVSFQPEELETIEVGIKTQFLDNHLRLNAAVFSNTYSDIQLTFNDCTAQFGSVFGRPCLLNSNAGDADVTGYELEFDFLATDNLLIDGSLSTLDFEFTRLNPATGVALTAVPPYTPETTWALGVQYDWNTSLGTVRPRLDVSYRDDVFTAPDNTALGRIDSYTLLNGSIRWIAKDETWSLAVEGRNLTDELYYTAKVDATTGLAGSVYGSPALPRTVMLTVRRDF
ncbi:MAG: TonB-dependent receptor [Hyphomonadaceae bacterium]|nr:MAG: TonB-dependent receptor-like protein [Caulobacteraceae bacterium]MBT9447182.1 TonB-dependent receptor [Hyphomonadaceae bacterium]TPW08204.1 MAG: TonB-dependent receptor-like protein [Alphaproteobacteria bacterium]